MSTWYSLGGVIPVKSNLVPVKVDKEISKMLGEDSCLFEQCECKQTEFLSMIYIRVDNQMSYSTMHQIHNLIVRLVKKFLLPGKVAYFDERGDDFPGETKRCYIGPRQDILREKLAEQQRELDLRRRQVDKLTREIRKGGKNHLESEL